MKYTEEQIVNAARTAHEVNRVYCQGIGDHSQTIWSLAPDWQKESAVNGVKNIVSGNHSPSASHESWLAEKVRTGWKHGPVKNVERREHPCMVPYDRLPFEQKVKDILFTHAVRGVLGIDPT